MKKMLSKKNIEDILALTPMQEGMLYHYLKEPESALYFEQLSLEVSGELRWATFKKTWNAVIATNEMLRTVFRWEKVESPIQLTLKEHMIRPERYDCTGKNPAEERKRLEEIKAKDREKKFHLTTPPFRVTLCKIGGGKHVIIISNHHILYDGWSNGIILEEFFRTYNRLADGQEIVKSSKTRFKEFVKKVRTRETTGLDAYWQEYLAGSPATSLPLKKRSKARRSYPLKHKQQWSKETYERLAEYLRENRSTMAAMLYSAWGILLQRYNNTRDVVFGTTVSGRSATVTGIEKMVGLFINTLPVRVTNQPGEVSRNMNRRINSDLRERQAYESTPLVKIAEFAGTAGEELFETIVVIENYPLDSRLRETAGTLTPGAYSTLEMTHYDLTVVVSLMDEITVDFIFNPAILEKKEVKRIAAHYLAVVEAMLKTPLKEPHLLDILTEKEKQRILYDFNRTGSQYPKTETIPQLFEKQVETTPDAIAIIGTTSTLFTSFKTSTISTTSTTCSLTYRELNRETDLLSRELKQKGVRTGIIVGIMVERSVEMAIGVLGILKAGGAYLPVNPGYPTERISYMLADSSVQHLLTVSTTGNRNEFGKNKIFLDKKKESRLAGGSYNSAGGAGSACSACSEGRGNSTKDTTRAQDPAYIIYTS
ncbi:MAG: AMP-binding protein, partial [bacterium]|nr:AMP-binding protein [bacterium]